MTAYGGGRQVEPLGQVGSGRGSVDEDRPDDALTCRLVAGDGCPGLTLAPAFEFHNTSVPLMIWVIQVRVT